MSNEWMYLSPDYRKDPPKDTALYCCRCQRKGEASLISVELSEDGLYIKKNPFGNALIGSTCLRIVEQEHFNKPGGESTNHYKGVRQTK